MNSINTCLHWFDWYICDASLFPLWLNYRPPVFMSDVNASPTPIGLTSSWQPAIVILEESPEGRLARGFLPLPEFTLIDKKVRKQGARKQRESAAREAAYFKAGRRCASGAEVKVSFRFTFPFFCSRLLSCAVLRLMKARGVILSLKGGVLQREWSEARWGRTVTAGRMWQDRTDKTRNRRRACTYKVALKLREVKPCSERLQKFSGLGCFDGVLVGGHSGWTVLSELLRNVCWAAVCQEDETPIA